MEYVLYRSFDLVLRPVLSVEFVSNYEYFRLIHMNAKQTELKTLNVDCRRYTYTTIDIEGLTLETQTGSQGGTVIAQSLALRM
jgi:hypothetical protein